MSNAIGKKVLYKITDPDETARMIKNRGFAPDLVFVSAAGRTHGFVEAWDIGGARWLVTFGDEDKEYHLFELGEPQDLSEYLLSEFAGDKLKAITQEANVRGIRAIRIARRSDHGWFAVLKTTYEMEWVNKTDAVCDGMDDPRMFKTFVDAERWVEEITLEDLWMGETEVSRPKFTIVLI